MNKKELIAKIAESQNITKVKAEQIVETLFDTIIEELKAGEDVRISNFGNFTVKTKKERVSIVPNTDKKVLVPAYKTASFKASKNFKEDVN